MIVRMAKVRIIGPKSLLQAATEQLQDLGLLHVESRPAYDEPGWPDRFIVEPQQLAKRTDLERLGLELDQVLASLPVLDGRIEEVPVDTALEEIRARTEAAVREVSDLLAHTRQYEEEQSLLIKYEQVLEAVGPLLSRVSTSRDLEFLGLLLQTTDPALVGAARKALSELTGDKFELFLTRLDDDTLAGILVVPKDLSGKVRSFLWSENISEMRLPSDLSEMPVSDALRILLRRRTELPIKLKALADTLRDASARWRPSLSAYRRIVENRIAQIGSTAYFYETRSTFLVYGWTPEEAWPVLLARLTDQFGGRVVAERTRIATREMNAVPVVLRNPEWLRPFEVFTRLMALPRYGSIDPTPFFAIFFPFFFGLILGDLGYGAILCAVAVVARRKWRNHRLVHDLSAVFLVSSGWAMGFGVLYGELFGNLGERIGFHPILINRMEAFLLMLKFALGIGLVHVFLGGVLGLITACRRRDRREILLKTFSLGFLVAVFLLICSLAGLVPPGFAAVGAIGAAVFVPPIIVFGGPKAVAEFHHVVSVLSYLRLMGIGVASAALAFAANTLGGLAGNIFLGIAIGLFFHLINLVFGVVSPTIQSLRLHYVEFFENFFEAGGRAYRPFRKV